MEIKHITPLGFCISYDSYQERDPRSEIARWLDDNIKRTYFTYSVYVTFRSKYDVLLFKMRWCT